MNYSNDYLRLKSVFSFDKRVISIPESNVKILIENFDSEIDPGHFLKRDDFSISENLKFSYPIIVPENIGTHKVILFLHGLNERSWIKYLAWAYWLSVITESYVVLFPISFHINRSPSSWVDPRKMHLPLEERTRSCNEVVMSTFANIALSNRLSEEPLRFFNSGYQTAFDIVKLLTQIREGTHNIIPAGCQINIFAYSIGAFLAQILLMGNPEGLFSDSRLFMFCGGSVFSRMKGTSRFIMDSEAFNRIYSYYLDEFENDIDKKNLFSEFLRSTQIGMAFRSMIDFGRLKSFREQIFTKLRYQIRSVALKKDTVIPAEGIFETMAGYSGNKNSQIEVWDFPYNYSHENPFPVNKNNTVSDVDKSFRKMIQTAGIFLT